VQDIPRRVETDEADQVVEASVDAVPARMNPARDPVVDVEDLDAPVSAQAQQPVDVAACEARACDRNSRGCAAAWDRRLLSPVAHADEVLENPATGERVVFRQTAADTNGELLEYEFVFRPRGFVAATHVHPRQEERHEVLAGRLGIAVAGRKEVLR